MLSFSYQKEFYTADTYLMDVFLAPHLYPIQCGMCAQV